MHLAASDIKNLGTIMGVWAHPDDEVMSMCGILRTAVKNRQDVVCIIATRGEAGLQDESRWPARHLGQIRERELMNAYQRIGITQYHFLGYPDGGCAEIQDNQAVQRLMSLVETYQPDTIMTFGPDGMTGHPDHRAVSRWAGLAVQRASRKTKLYHSILTEGQRAALQPVDDRFNFFFNVDRPKTCADDDCDIRLVLDDELFACKLDCLRAMPSQFEGVLKEFDVQLRPGIGVEAFVQAPHPLQGFEHS